MLLYRKSRSNGAAEPWNEAIEWAFEVRCDWTVFLFGAAKHDTVYVLWVGPLSFIYYYDKDAN